MTRNPKRLIRSAHEHGPDAPVDLLDLGVRLRELRRARGWTLEQAAGSAGLARSTMAKIETGLMSPTCGALKKARLCPVDHRTAPVSPPAKGQVSLRMAVTKSDELQAHALPPLGHEPLGSGKRPFERLWDVPQGGLPASSRRPENLSGTSLRPDSHPM